jgi:hypothetical protein
MKLRNDYVSNSSSSSFIVDCDTYNRYYEKYGAPEIEANYCDGLHNGLKCVEFYGYDDEHNVEGYDNDEECVRSIYDTMCMLDPEFIKWSNNH